MKFVQYNPLPGSGCVVRTFSKLLDKDSKKIIKDLEKIAKKLGYQNIHEIEVFDTYFKKNHYLKKEMSIPVQELKYKKGKIGVFCYQEDDYHMFAIIDGVIYDKDQEYLNKTVIAVYEYQK